MLARCNRAEWRVTVLSEVASGHAACSRAHLALPCPVQHYLLRGSGHLWHHRGNHPANKDRLGAAVAGHWAVVERVLPGRLCHIRVRPDHWLGEPCLRVTALLIGATMPACNLGVLAPLPATASNCMRILRSPMQLGDHLIHCAMLQTVRRHCRQLGSAFRCPGCDPVRQNPGGGNLWQRARPLRGEMLMQIHIIMS